MQEKARSAHEHEKDRKTDKREEHLRRPMSEGKQESEETDKSTHIGNDKKTAWWRI